MSSFEYAGPTVTDEMAKQTTKQQMKSALKDMGTRSYSMAKNFAVVGAIYSGTECCIESVSVDDKSMVCEIFDLITICNLVSCQERFV